MGRGRPPRGGGGAWDRQRLGILLRWAAVVVILNGLVSLWTHPASAAPPFAGTVGDGATGLPSIGRVGIAAPRAPRVTLAPTTGYGFTEAQGADSGPHHRAVGSLGLALQPWTFFAAALALEGRYDKHPDDALGSDDGFVGDPRLTLRASRAFNDTIALGAQVVGWFLGGKAPSLELDATTVDAAALFTFAPRDLGLVIGANAGYRFDRSARSVGALAQLRAGDRLALQLSQFDAALFGIGASKRIGATEILGELTWDLLVGEGAPSAMVSPLRASIGARYHASERVQIELRPEVALSERPPVEPNAPLIPVEPRFTMLVSLRWVLPFSSPVVQPGPMETKPGAAATPNPATEPATGSLQGRVADADGKPIAGAVVEAQAGDVTRSATTDANGAYTITGVPVGTVRVVTNAKGYDEARSDVTVTASGKGTNLDLPMKRAVKPAQLRGLVRSFTGAPLRATIRIEPIGTEVKTDADGTFKIDVPPGAYTIVIESPGHAGQRRPARVEENGVTVLNVDLRRGR